MSFPLLYDAPALASAVHEPNAGGVCRLRLVPASLVTLMLPERFPMAGKGGYAEHTVSAQHLTFTPGASIIDVGILPQYCSFTDVGEATPNGMVYRPTIQIMLPKVRPAVVTWVAAFQEVRFIAFLEDRNGFFRMAGIPDQPLIIAPNFGQTMGFGANQTVLTFAGETERPAFFLLGIDNADLIDAGAFSDAFGFMFD